MEYQTSQVRPKSDYEDMEEDIWDEHIGNDQNKSHSKGHKQILFNYIQGISSQTVISNLALLRI